MSRFTGDASPRTIFASKTTFDALDVQSGEESEEDNSSDLDLLQQSLTAEPVKPTKSAIKKANRLARIERKQRQKLKLPASEETQTTNPNPFEDSISPVSTPVTSFKVEEFSQPLPAATPSEPAELRVILEAQPRVEANGYAHAETLKPVLSEDVEVEKTTRVVVTSPSLPTHKTIPADTETTTEATPSVNGSAKNADQNGKPAAQGQDTESAKRRQNALTRTLWTFIMIGGFVGLLLLGHTYMILLVLLCQTLVYREVTALFSLKTAIPESRDAETLKGKDPWSKTLNWYFFAVTNYFLYGESIIYYFKHVVFADANLLPFATNHRMISFTLYIIGFMGFVMSLKKGYLKQQFGLFCWVHMSLLLIVVSSHFIVNNILEGLIWFWVPASLVICNDCFAYICGVMFGRTPLIKLSPKKTVEGFLGAFVSTILFAILWGTFFMKFDYMICPVHDLGVSAFSSTTCAPNPVFVWKTVEVWRPLSAVLTALTTQPIKTISYAPYQLHLFVLACFASLVAPFGGFFASGFKRAFNIKDFGHSIPGHGGMTDRMDCQFLMGVFTYVYYSSLIRVNHVTVGNILQTIVSGLTVDQQLELVRDLSRYLEGQGISV
ncbi:phosphatidate cytidylyltransferase [Pholiota molesta]|nr:phosphatidate cytidylyltransferase [Pholiota molesta]